MSEFVKSQQELRANLTAQIQESLDKAEERGGLDQETLNKVNALEADIVAVPKREHATVLLDDKPAAVVVRCLLHQQRAVEAEGGKRRYRFDGSAAGRHG